MDRDLLVKRLADIDAAVAQSLANHHILLGRLEETKYNIEQYDLQVAADKEKAKEAKKVK